MAAPPEMGCCLRSDTRAILAAALKQMVSMGLVLVGSCSIQAATYCVTVAGLGGEPDYEQRFGSWAQDIDKTLKAAGSDVRSETLQGAEAAKAKVKETLERIAKSSTAQDNLVLMLIGHGSFDGTEYKMNVPGPDISGVELATMLDRVPAGRQLVVNMTSASGASVHALQKPNRTVITATKSGTEKNATVFARYWIEALRDAAADTDKNEVITALEAFRYAEQKTKQFYETNKRLATEHPVLDGGDQNGQLNAGRFALLRLGSLQEAFKDPGKQALLAKREELEGQIDQLKFKKAAMPTDEYKKQLSALLLELARTQAELDK
jgi:hypothetical protein